MKKIFCSILAVLSMLTLVALLNAKNVKADYTAPEGNLIASSDFEENADGFYANGCTVAQSDEVAYNGTHSLKVSSRQANETWPGYNYDVKGIEFDTYYTYSFFVTTTAEGGADVQTMVSPWAVNDDTPTPNWLWAYVGGTWGHVAQNEWKEFSFDFKLTVIQDVLYLIKIDAEGDESPVQIVNQGGATTNTKFASLDNVRISSAASANVDLFFDCVTVAPAEEENNPGGEGGNQNTEKSHEFTPAQSNLVENWGFETDATGYEGNGCDIAASDARFYNGTKSLKISNRQPGQTWPGFNLNVNTIQLDKVYAYKFFVSTNAEAGADVQTVLSPWAINNDAASGNRWLYTYACGQWTHVEKGAWLELTYEFKLTVVDGQLFVVTLDADGEEAFALCTNDNGGNVYESLSFVRFSVGGSADTDLYVDCVTVSEIADFTKEEEPTHEEFVPATNNVNANWDCEEITGYTGVGADVALSTEKAYHGEHSLYVSNRAPGESYPCFSIDVAAPQAGKKYTYSFYIYNPAAEDIAIQTTYSPWGQAEGGAWVWTYSCCSWMAAKAQQWTLVTQTFEIREVQNKFYIVMLDAEGEETFNQIKDYNGTAEDVVSFAISRLQCAATPAASFYIDCVTFNEVVEEEPFVYEPIKDNLNGNWDCEEITGYSGNGCDVTLSDDYALNGTHSIKVSNRTPDQVWPGFSIDIQNIQMGKKYTYEFYIYNPAAEDIAIQTTFSPWGQAEGGAWVWVYTCCPWMAAKAQQWTKVSQTFELREVQGKFYVVMTDDQGDESFNQIKDYNGTAEDLASTLFARLQCAATAGASFYVDCVSLYEVTEQGGGGEGGDPTEPAEAPTGHAGGEDASLIEGNMIQNATFDTKLFSKECTNSGMWYYSSPEKVEICDTYSQDGTEYGSSARLYNRQGATASFMSRTLNIWVSNQYRLSGYVSSLEATKGSIVVRMWSYYDEYTDADPVQRYPYAEYVLPLQDVKPGEWTKYDVTFGWSYDTETGILTLQIYDYDTKEIIHEVSTTQTTGLSAFEFEFRTDSTDENYLTDLYFDNYTLFNVTKYIQNIPEENPEDPDDPDEPIVIDPTEPEDPDDGDDKEPAKKSGCGSSVTVTLVSGVILTISLLGLSIKKRKED